MLKVMACKLLILKPIDYECTKLNGEYIFLVCDASISGIGLYYGQGREWETCHPAGFLSKKFSVAQLSYQTYEQETLAILEGLLHWEDKFLGREIVIITDHKTLEFFNTQCSMSLRQVRWYEYLSRFNYSIQYVEGLKNVVANAHSRMYTGQNTDIPVNDWVNVDIRLNPEGETLPVDRLLESRAMQLWPYTWKLVSVVLRDAAELRIEESVRMQGYLEEPKQCMPLQHIQFANLCKPACEGRNRLVANHNYVLRRSQTCRAHRQPVLEGKQHALHKRAGAGYKVPSSHDVPLVDGHDLMVQPPHDQQLHNELVLGATGPGLSSHKAVCPVGDV
jgi:hypothetical protein